MTTGLLRTLVDRAACLAGTLDNRIAGRADIFAHSTGRRSNKNARGTQALPIALPPVASPLPASTPTTSASM